MLSRDYKEAKKISNESVTSYQFIICIDKKQIIINNLLRKFKLKEDSVMNL